MKLLFVYVKILILISVVNCEPIYLDLGGTEWQAEGTHSSTTAVIKLAQTSVPGCVHTDWLKGKSYDQDPYYRFNDANLQWIAKMDWKYSLQFKTVNELLRHQEQWLVLEGVDTIANISLNGKMIGSTYDMFVKYKFNVTGLLQLNFNMLSVSFKSAVNYVDSNSKLLPYEIPPSCPPDVQHGFCHVNLIRKEQSSFSWDWGPGFATQGIWKPIYIMAYSYPVLSKATGSYDADHNVLHIDTSFDKVDETSTGNLLVEIKELNVKKEFPNLQISSSNTHSFVIDLENVNYKKWWPNGHGEPNMYNISLSFTSSNHTTNKFFMFGFRKVELIQEPISNSTGLSFYFKINDVAIFSKGANWIPADAFTNRVSPDKYFNLLQSAMLANMNMLRVWGGGIYEDDYFYEVADNMGIMLWQDFMFACAFYPTSDEFLSNVTEEVENTLWRLKHHPSIVIWAGNNENEAALATNWYNTTSHFKRYKDDYVKLYHETIGKIVEKFDPARPFLTSSPTNGKESVSEGYVATNPYSVYYGDVHYYNYDDNCLDWSKYPKTRFASEYGFQSWPSLETLLPVTVEEDLSFHSNWSEHRQHHAQGQQQMLDQISMHFQLPDTVNKTELFDNMIYLTQMMQALCYKSQTEFYLRSRNEIVKGQGHTMGALYWQLNDIWQAPSWSSMEYGGKWKMLHYFAKDFFAPVSLIAYDDDTELTVYTSSHLHHTISATIVVSILSTTQFGVLGTFKTPVTIPLNQAENQIVQSVGYLLHYGNCPYKEVCYISVHLENNTDVPQTFFYPVAFKDIEGLSKPDIKAQKIVAVLDYFEITLTAKSPALFTWVKALGIRGRFSENGFPMFESEKTIYFYPWQLSVTTETLQNSLKIKSLADIYTKGLNEGAEAFVIGGGPYQTWLDDVNAKLVFAVLGLFFLTITAVQFTCVVLRLNTTRNYRNVSMIGHKRPITLNSNPASFTSVTTVSTVPECEPDEMMSFLIQSKKANGQEGKKKEIRFYVI